VPEEALANRRAAHRCGPKRKRRPGRLGFSIPARARDATDKVCVYARAADASASCPERARSREGASSPGLCGRSLQRDPLAYDEPDALRPERWSSGPLDSAFLPSGGGGRRCLGRTSRAHVLTALAPAVLQRRRLRPLRGEPETMLVRGTILVPTRSAPMLANAGSPSTGRAALA
jgi:Cytochrome P450